MNDSTIQLPVDVTQIMSMLPHRYPFLLVDRVIEITPNESLAAIKNVTMNEPFFQGHFPGHPVMPGGLVIEAMAQAAGLLTQLSDDGSDGGDDACHRRAVAPEPLPRGADALSEGAAAPGAATPASAARRTWQSPFH